MKENGFRGCTVLGRRKNATIGLPEAGCSTEEAQSITGQATLRMLEYSGAQGEQKALAGPAITKLANAHRTNSLKPRVKPGR